MANLGTYATNGEKIKQLREAAGYADADEFCRKAGFSLPTLKRAESGGPSYEKTLAAIAKLLPVESWHQLRADPNGHSIQGFLGVQTFKLDIKLAGTASMPHHPQLILNLTSELIQRLSEHGIYVDEATSHATLTENKRIFVPFFGSKGEQRFYIFMAIKPSRFNDLLSACKSGSLRVSHLPSYGELIAGEWKAFPTPEDFIKIAEGLGVELRELLRAIREAPTDFSPVRYVEYDPNQDRLTSKRLPK